MLDVFSLVARLTLNTEDYENNLEAAKKKGGGIGSALKTAMKVGVAAVSAASGALVAFGKSAVDAGLSFDATMSEVAAISGATGEDFDALRKKAQEMGATTKFSASESAEALTYMAMAGWKTEDMLGGIEGIMNLAAASGENLATTSDIVTDALTAFGLAAEDSGHFADVLAAASSNANTNVSMLGESFKYVAPVAGAMGFSAEDTSVALSLMANAGIKASQGGTALRTVLGNMAKPTDEMAAAMYALGVSLTDEEGNMLSLMDVMKQLRKGFKEGGVSQEEYDQQIKYLNADLAAGKIDQEKYNEQLEYWGVALNGATEAQQAQFAAMLAGKEGMSGLLAIVNSSDADFEKLTASIYSADGAAAQMAATMQNNLQGDLTIMQSALEGLKIAVSDKLTPSLREFVKFGSDGLSRLTVAFQEGGLSGAMSEFGNILSDGISMIISKLPEIVSAGAKLIGALAEGLINNLPAILDAGMEVVFVLVDGIIDALPDLIPAVVNVILTITEKLTDPDMIMKLIDAAFRIIGAIAEGLINAIPELVREAPKIITNLLEVFSGMFPQIIESGAQMVASIIEGIGNMVGPLVEKGAEIVKNFIDSAKEKISDLLALGADIVGGVWDGISGKAKEFGDKVKGFFDGIVSGVKKTLGINSPSKLFRDVIGKNIVSGLTGGIDSYGKTAISAAEKLAENVYGSFQGLDSDITNLVEGSFPKDLYSDRINGIASSLEANNRFSYDYASGRRSEEAERPINVEFVFNGNLAQIARILQPEIVIEGKRRGTALAVGV